MRRREMEKQAGVREEKKERRPRGRAELRAADGH